MLYCKNCGQQVSDAEQYCPSCGAKIEAAAPASNPYNSAPGYNPNPNPGYNPAPNPAPNPYGSAPRRSAGATGLAALGSNMVLYFVSVGLLLLNIIFMYCPNITFGVEMWGQSYSESLCMFTDPEGDFSFLPVFGVFMLLAYIGGIVLSLLPLLIKKPFAKKFFLCGKIACIFGLCVYPKFCKNYPYGKRKFKSEPNFEEKSKIRLAFFGCVWYN